MSTYEILHDRSVGIWERSTNHPMVRAIGDGSLPKETFRYYFEQNIQYLRNYSRAIALAISRAPDQDAIDVLGEFLRGESEREIPMNYSFLRRLGGDPDAIDPRSMNSANYGYSRHILATAALGDTADALAAILPCPCSYNEFAKEMVREVPDDPLYAEWIKRFGEDDENDDIIDRLRLLLDRLSDPDDTEQVARLGWIFDVSSRYEVMFWDAALSKGSPGPAGW